MITKKMMWITLVWFLPSVSAFSSSHWVVTENGRGSIQPQIDSPFYLQHPDDLIALLEQEKRVTEINRLYDYLSLKKDELDLKWKNVKSKYNIENEYPINNPECIEVSQLYSQLDFYPIVLSYLNHRISVEEYLPLNSPTKGNSEPDCKGNGNPEISMYTFDHLKVMMNRSTLFIKPTPAMVPVLIGGRKPKQFASQISMALKKNTTSWWHYQMASLYWQIVGNAPKAVECARVAVYHSPRHYRDVALLNLGSLVHRCQYFLDALIIMTAAADHGSYAENYFLLGNIYATLHIHNRSVACYENAFALQPEWTDLLRPKTIVTCYHKLHQELFAAHTELHMLLQELHAYHRMIETWHGHQRKLQVEQVPPHLRSFSQSYYKYADKVRDKGLGCYQRYYYERPLYVCDWSGNRVDPEEKFQMNIYVEIQSIIKHIETEGAKINILVNHDPILAGDGEGCVIGKLYSPVTAKWLVNFTIIVSSSSLNEDSHKDIPNKTGGTNKIINRSDDGDHGHAMLILEKINDYLLEAKNAMGKTRADEDPDDSDTEDDSDDYMKIIIQLNDKKGKAEIGSLGSEPKDSIDKTIALEMNMKNESWPSEEDCLRISPYFPDLTKFPTIFLPPENKGFNVRHYLGKAIGLQENERHHLPWYPPLCIQKNTAPPKVIATRDAKETHLRNQLLSYAANSDVVEAEIGQRILTALEKGIEPRWVLETIAGLYWLVRGNMGNALDCLYTAQGTVPTKFFDVVAVPLCSIFVKVNALFEATEMAKKCLKTDSSQPASHFLMASVEILKCNFSGAMYHLKTVWRLDRDFIAPGTVQNYIQAVSCRAKFPHLSEFLSNTQINCEAAKTIIRNSQIRKAMESKTKMYDTLVCSESGTECHVMQMPFSMSEDLKDEKEKLVMVGSSPVKVTPVVPECKSESCGAPPDVESESSDVTASSEEEDEEFYGEDESKLERVNSNHQVKVGEKERMSRHSSVDSSKSERTKKPDSPPKLEIVYKKRSSQKSDKKKDLSRSECVNLETISWLKMEVMAYESTVVTLNWEALLNHESSMSADLPVCSYYIPPSDHTLDNIVSVRLRDKLISPDDPGIREWFRLIMLENTHGNQNLVKKIASILHENPSLWYVSFLASVYWRTVSDISKALSCFRQTLHFVPSEKRFIPLIYMADLLHKAGLFNDALIVGNMALELNPQSEAAHYTVGCIYTSVPNFEKATTHFHSALAINSAFVPADTRLKSLQCAQIIENYRVKTGP